MIKTNYLQIDKPTFRPYEEDIKKIAYLFWQYEGKQDNKDQEYYFKGEKYLQSVYQYTNFENYCEIIHELRRK